MVIGPTLGLVFVCVIMPAVMALAIAFDADRTPLAAKFLRLTTALTTTALCSGAIATWAAGLATGLQSTALSLALAGAMVGVIGTLARLRVSVDTARGLAGAALMAWLTWPIWMAPHWTNPAAAPWLDAMLPYQPLLAINAPAIALGPWSHQPIAYRYLLNLGQDVPYALPSSAWPAIFAHTVLAVLLITTGTYHCRRVARFDGNLSRPVIDRQQLRETAGRRDGDDAAGGGACSGSDPPAGHRRADAD